MIFHLIKVLNSSWWLNTATNKVHCSPVNGDDKAVHPTDSSLSFAVDLDNLESQTKQLWCDVDDYHIPLIGTDLPKRVSLEEIQMLKKLINISSRESIESVQKALNN